MNPSKLSNANRALLQLEEFIKVTNPSPIELAGIVQAFEFTFEVIWKLLQSYAFEQGIVANSPKMAIKAAFQMRVISDEKLWLKILESRNLTVHTYNEDLAVQLYKEIRDNFTKALREALTKLESS